MPRVANHPQFETEVVAQIEHLREQGDIDRILGLFGDFSELRQLLARFPEAGRELARSGERSLRTIRLRRAPFVVWYRYAPDLDEVTLYRLFHRRQDRPPPRLPA